MKKITVPTREQVSPESQLLFDVLQKRAGKVPNLYATMGRSAFALQGFMNLEDTVMELVGLVMVRLFTNYVFALTNIPIDFPLAEPLSQV